LNDGLFYCSQEAETGWSITSMQEDLVHVLINGYCVEGMDHHLRWSDVNRQE